MVRVNWRIYSVIGGLIAAGVLIVGGWTYGQYRFKNETERKQAVAQDIGRRGEDSQINCSMIGKREFKCIAQAPNTEAADEHTKADLKAQQDVAEWSFLNLWLTGLGIVLSALAVGFTGWAALAAAKAAEAKNHETCN